MGQQLYLSPGITRRPKPLLKMRATVSAVGCMPLLDAAFAFTVPTPANAY
jgi:hypothetical protein